MKYEKVTGSIFDLKDEFEKGELYAADISIDGDSVTYEVVSCERDLLKALYSNLIYRQAKPKKTYRGVELPEWADRLTWDESGKCFAWCCGAKLINNSKDFPEWLDRDDGLVCFVKELTREPFTDDSWKDSLIKL